MNYHSPEKFKNFIPALGARWATRFYDPVVRLTTREYLFKRALINQAGLSNNQRVLDLACGTGTLSRGIKRRFPEIILTAVDADPDILEIALQKTDQTYYGIEYQHAFSDSLPFATGTFDRVISTLFFHHLNREMKQKAMKEVYRVLKPNGEFHLADYGRPEGISQIALSQIVKFVDGYESTKDNFDGNLLEMIRAANMQSAAETCRFKTPLGTIRLFRAEK